MALKNKSLFLYGFEVDETNCSLDFIAASGGPTLAATLKHGYYSLNALMTEISRSMKEVDTTTGRVYTVTANRNVNSGTENRVTISTNGTHLSLRFASGPRAASSIANLIGFLIQDYTGATTYTGSSTCGTALVSTEVGYNYLPPELSKRVQGAVSISASGEKESIVFNRMKFWQVEFKYEPESKVVLQWQPFMDWCIDQKLVEFTPDITAPTTFYEGTLEKTSADGKGLAYQFKEMLPDFPFLYTTDMLTFRVRIVASRYT